ncbi:HEPN domain-containing protein [Dyadobacter chenhuakuii]|uniref:HEPN domain-containing protein n=1 Tax=Dyadobacter chenhuakuii TaxID=2909339 RepID=A0ABY4XKV5_9BACT|nr:HEPN domain-containing protein [Dyadobacter chenhuakuii]MCF2493729.1 HEPN domain-containing protein [Dyadobacter chenhuakuii]USJ30863.1 HEPN domain-containing protein [Dyadobacter chenhuakuii]
MNEAGFDKEKVINYWIRSSDDDFETMMAMLDSKRYAWSLFVGHLMIEKLLKALFVKVNNEFPPFTHNLLRIAEKSNIELDEKRKLFLVSVTAFNINSRYDDYKMSFQKTCTPEFTGNWIEQLKEYRQWIKDLIKH